MVGVVVVVVEVGVVDCGVPSPSSCLSPSHQSSPFQTSLVVAVAKIQGIQMEDDEVAEVEEEVLS